MEGVFSGCSTFYQKDKDEGVGDRFASPRHPTPTGNAPIDVLFAYRPLKRRLRPIEEEVPPPGQRAKSIFERFLVVLLTLAMGMLV